MDFDQECINDFIEESEENLDLLDQSFVLLEQDLQNEQELDKIFRAVHTIKGGCRLIGFERLEKISHIAEELLDLAREKKLDLTSEHISLLLKSVDVFRFFINYLKEHNKEAENTCDLLVQELTAASKGENFNTSFNVEELIDPSITSSESTVEDQSSSELPSDENEEIPEPTKSQDNSEINEIETLEQKEETQHNDEKTEHQKNAADSSGDEWDEVDDEGHWEEQHSNQSSALPQLSDADIKDDLFNPNKLNLDPSQNQAQETVRIDVNRLDTLMNLVGELVLSRNQLKQLNQQIQDPALNVTTSAISLITSELQEEVVKSRLQPISIVLVKFQRTIRDLSKSVNKEVDLVISGGNTELDRTLLESIKDPLTHIIRNSVDHGIEAPEVREKSGKNRKGTVHISCTHEGGQVIIDIRDDGGGLNAKKIAEKAISKGLYTQEAIAKMKDKDIYNCIFLPGFSTAETVTNISGRGVGMDVVKTNITSIGGQIELDSTPGKSTTVHLQIPLTLAIVPALMVDVQSKKFAIPQSSLQELILIEKKDFHQIESFEGTEVYRLRGKLLPLLRLRPLMNLSEEDLPYYYIIVLNAGDQTFGLIVDEVDDTEEIVVKPLAKFFCNIKVYSGATIMGDGSISLILDVEAMANMANLNAVQTDNKNAKLLTRTRAASTALIFSLGGEELLGVQMSQISRLEEIKAQDIEMAGTQEVIQYRGDLLPIIRLSSHMEIEENYERERLSLIVFSIHDREVGLLAREIIDAHLLEGELDSEVIQHPLVLGTMIIKDNVIMLIDALKIFEMSFTQWKPQQQLPQGQQKILYVDDSPFYLKVVARYLKDAGYEVDTCLNPLAALEMIKSTTYSLLVLDYEMPDMDGKELAEHVRTLDQYNLVPIIILTALTSLADKKAIINSGIQSYLIKLNKEELLNEISKLLELNVVEI